jgi:hypothetical protein
MDPLELGAEITLAGVGIVPILQGKPKLPAHPPNLPKEIRALVLKFLASPAPARLEDLPPFDWDEVHALLDRAASEEGTKANVDALHAAIPGELGDGVEHTATAIISALQEAFPAATSVREDIVGTIVTPGPEMAVARFARMWSVALDPLIPLRDLCQGSITTDMVQAMTLFWPALYEMAKTEVAMQVAEMRTKRPKWEPEPRRARLLKMLMGQPYVNVELAADFQQLYAQQADAKAAAAPAGGGGGGSKKPAEVGEDSMLTPGQA